MEKLRKQTFWHSRLHQMNGEHIQNMNLCYYFTIETQVRGEVFVCLEMIAKLPRYRERDLWDNANFHSNQQKNVEQEES